MPFEIFYDIKYSIFIHQRKYCRYEDIDGFFPSTKFLERKSPEISFDHLIFFNTRSISGFVALNIQSIIYFRTNSLIDSKMFQT